MNAFSTQQVFALMKAFNVSSAECREKLAECFSSPSTSSWRQRCLTPGISPTSVKSDGSRGSRRSDGSRDSRKSKASRGSRKSKASRGSHTKSGEDGGESSSDDGGETDKSK